MHQLVQMSSNLIKSDVIEDKSFTDLTLLVDNVQVGQQVRKILMSNDKGIKVSTTFEDEKSKIDMKIEEKN